MFGTFTLFLQKRENNEMSSSNVKMGTEEAPCEDLGKKMHPIRYLKWCAVKLFRR